ncbi:MAG: response regulator transcription factor [Sandarakinorhabdus sp.]|nr:response regulator transcription factor [Sandarakinorhabdus sp.]
MAAAMGVFDIIIADGMLPGGDGIALVGAIRAAGQRCPVLMLTALGSIEDRVAGLEGGADDYLVKPFSIVELAARVTALARRPALAAEPATVLAVDTLVLDRLARTVRRGGVAIDLQPREFQLLELLLLERPRVLTRSMLLQAIWHFNFDPGTNIVESHISRLRAKIDRGAQRPLIATIRGEGYAIRPD